MAVYQLAGVNLQDYTVLLASTDAEMAELLQLVETTSEEAGLKLNRKKCSIMVVDRAKQLPRNFNLIPDIERKDLVLYLGTYLFNNEGGCNEEINRRIGLAKAAINKLIKIWKDRGI